MTTSPANPIVLKKSPSSANSSLEKTDEVLTSTEIEWMIPKMMTSSFLATIPIFLSSTHRDPRAQLYHYSVCHETEKGQVDDAF